MNMSLHRVAIHILYLDVCLSSTHRPVAITNIDTNPQHGRRTYSFFPEAVCVNEKRKVGPEENGGKEEKDENIKS